MKLYHRKRHKLIDLLENICSSYQLDNNRCCDLTDKLPLISNEFRLSLKGTQLR